VRALVSRTDGSFVGAFYGESVSMARPSDLLGIVDW
jgi:hypothetical protein